MVFAGGLIAAFALPRGAVAVPATGAGSEMAHPAFDCRTKEVWTSEKQEWCCVHRGVDCPATPITENDLDPDLEIDSSSGSEDGVLPGALAPPWTRGELEPPAGERAGPGGSTLAVYTAEQQRRLGVTEWGEPVAEGEADAAVPGLAEDEPELMFDGDGWHTARCFCYNGSAVVEPIRGDGGGGHHHWWGRHRHHDHDGMGCAEGSEPICEASTRVIHAMMFVFFLMVLSVTLCCQRFCCRKSCARLLGYGGVAAAGSKSIPSHFFLDSDTDLNSPVHLLQHPTQGKFDEFEFREVPPHQSKV